MRHGRGAGGLNLKGYLADLKKAYRQVPRRESQRSVSFIAFWHTILNKVMFAEHLGQPFGSSAAVNNFNRLGRALQALFVKLLQVCTLQYYDDCTGVEPEVLAKHSMDTIMAGLAILGFAVECKGEPNGVYTLLGIVIDTTRADSERLLEVRNSATCEKKIRSEINDILASNNLPPGRAGKLRGTCSSPLHNI